MSQSSPTMYEEEYEDPQIELLGSVTHENVVFDLNLNHFQLRFSIIQPRKGKWISVIVTNDGDDRDIRLLGEIRRSHKTNSEIITFTFDIHYFKFVFIVPMPEESDQWVPIYTKLKIVD